MDKICEGSALLVLSLNHISVILVIKAVFRIVDIEQNFILEVKVVIMAKVYSFYWLFVLY